MPEELRLMPRSPRSPSPTMRDLLSVMFRQRNLAMMTFAAAMLAVLLYRLFTPLYQAEMKVLVRHGRVDPVVTATPTEPQFEHEEVTEEELNSEVELLHDQEILSTVAQASGLVADHDSWFRKWTGETERERLARAVRRLTNRLNVESVRKTTLIAVTYRSSDPAQAARVLQCLAGAYLERHSRLRRPLGESDFFAQQIAQSRRNLEQAEFRLMEFTQSEGVVSGAQERDNALQRLGQAEASERENQVSIAETGERVRMLRSKVQSLPERATTVIRNTDNPQLLGEIKSKLLDLELRRTQLLTKFAPSYRLVQEVEQQIKETEASIAGEELSPIREQTSDLDANHAWAKSELVKAEVELSSLRARAKAGAALVTDDQEQAHALGDRAIKQEDLLSNMKAAEEQYLLYVNKREEARIGDALDQERILNVIIAEQPTAPALPVRSALSIGLLGLALAGTLSTGVAFTADRLNPAFRTPDEVVAYLGAPVLAALPRRDG